MDSVLPELTRRFDGAAALGYLNFSDGRPDAKFRKLLADVFGYLREAGHTAPWNAVAAWLTARATELEQSGSAAFRDLGQARAAIPVAFRDVPVVYRRHHADLLAHQPDEGLFNAFFRDCQVLTADDATKAGRLALCDLTRRTLAQGLDLLGIEAPQRM